MHLTFAFETQLPSQTKKEKKLKLNPPKFVQLTQMFFLVPKIKTC